MFQRPAPYYKPSVPLAPAGFRFGDYIQRRCFNLFQGPDFINARSPDPSPLSSPVRGPAHPRDAYGPPTTGLRDFLRDILGSPQRPTTPTPASHPNAQPNRHAVPVNASPPILPRRKARRHGPKHLSFKKNSFRQSQRLKEKREALRRKHLKRQESRIGRPREEIGRLRGQAEALMEPEHTNREDRTFLEQLEKLEVDHEMEHGLEDWREHVARAAQETRERRRSHKARDANAVKLREEQDENEALEEQKRKVEEFIRKEDEEFEAECRRMEEEAMRADAERQRAHDAAERMIREEQERRYRKNLKRKVEEEERLKEAEERLKQEKERLRREEHERRLREERVRREQEERLRRLEEEERRIREEVEQARQVERDRLERERKLHQEIERLREEARERWRREERARREERSCKLREEIKRARQEANAWNEWQERTRREERERRAQEEFERARQAERERLGREEQERRQHEAERQRQEAHERFVREEKERLAREEQERHAAHLCAEQARRAAEEDQVRQYFMLYEAKWNELRTNNSIPPIDVLEMPWPVFGVVSSVDQITYQGVRTFLFHPLRPGVEGKSARDKVKAEVLRFHPDKFNTRIVPKFQVAHQTIAQEIAGAIARILTTIMTEVQK